jgi:hypothetical protein
MLSLFINIFGDEFIDNTAIVLTHWSQNKRDKKTSEEKEKK